MDDLEHSVVIAERDWESFYEESEECSIQQAWLASLDDSGFTDTDDEKNSTQEPVLDLQTKPDKPNKEPDPAALTHSEVYDCKVENPSEEPECLEPECLSYKTDNERSAGQTAQISLNEVPTACTCLTSGSSVSVNDASFANQDLTASDIKDFREHNENSSEGKSCQAISEPINSFPCIQDAGHVGSSEGETALKVSESSATPKKEKERWFVTVNDSPVMLRVKSGQKKGRKKKTSRKLVQQSTAAERQSSVSNNKKEEVMQDGQKFMQTYSESIYLNPCPNHFCEELILNSCSNQEINCTSEASSFIAEEENTSSAFRYKFKDNSDVPSETVENNPSASVNFPSPLILTDSAQLQIDSLVNDQSIANEPKSYMQATTPDHPMTNNLSHKVHEATEDNVSRLILEACSTNTPLEKLQEQEYLTQMQEELKWPSQEIQNQRSQEESLEAAVGSNCPIYALSSFWDEMEKLTINDILHLRSTHNRSTFSGSVIAEGSDVHLEDKDLLTSKHYSVEENGLTDDSADSGYYTHVDESKPDRSSCELSTLSDSDEEFLQILNRNGNPSIEPQLVKELTENLKSTYIPGNEFYPYEESESLDIIKLSHQVGIQHYLYPAIEVQSLFVESSQDSNGNPFELEVVRKTPVSSFGNTADNLSMLTFSEISTTDINGACSRLSSTVASSPFSHNLSVCEMYDDFFSDFEIGNFLFPSTQDKTVPIFSASRSVVRDLAFPEVEEHDFDPDFEEDNMLVRDMSRFSSQPEMSTSPSGMPNMCFSMSQRRNWSSLFSLRGIRFIGKGSTWHHKVNSWIFPKEAKRATSCISRAQLIAPLIQVGNRSVLQLAEPKKHAVSAFISKKEDFHFSIKQADMCLVCIAFASWVLKSYNSQSTDMWKAALLANISAISAIQYLRKYGKRQR